MSKYWIETSQTRGVPQSSEKILGIVTYPQFLKFLSVKVPSNFETFKCNCTLEHISEILIVLLLQNLNFVN
jgi:hypothetical protein